MKDGLYIVDRGSIYGAFVVRHGEVHNCAPVLRKNLGFYMSIARHVPTEGDPVEEQEEEEQSVTSNGDYPPPWRAGVE